MRHKGILRLIAFLSLLIGILLQLSAQTTPRTQAHPSHTRQSEHTPRLQIDSGYTTYLPLILASPPQMSDSISPFGITLYGPIDQANGLMEVQTAGVKWVTTSIDWGTIEPAEGQPDWSSFDIKVGNARAAGMQVFALVTGDPPWAWAPDQPATIVEKRVQFVRQLIERYDCDGLDDAPGQLCVHYWSFYAEPDAHIEALASTPGAKGYWGRRGDAYGDMIAAVADAAHAQDRGAKIMIGGVAYDWFEEDGGPFVASFLGDVLDRLNTHYGGAGNYLDAIAFHYFPLGFPSISDKAQAIRAIMRTYSVEQLPLIVPETGFWSASSVGSSETRQAEWVVQLYTQGIASDIEFLSWFTVFDDGGATEEHGLFRQQDLGQPKPAYTAYRVLAQELAGATFLRTLDQAGVAGYVFGMPGGAEKTVVWAIGATRTVRFTASCAKLTSILGGVTEIVDGAKEDRDRKKNGQVAIDVADHGPVYVAACD